MIKDIFTKHKFSKIIVYILIIIVLILLFKPVYDDAYNRYHLWQKDYPTSYVKTILRQNKKHYQRVADYATSDAILEDYVGEYYSYINPEYGVNYSIGLYDENLKIRDDKVIKSRDIVREKQHLWRIHASENKYGERYVSFEFYPPGFEPDGSIYWLDYYPKLDLESYNSMMEYGYEDLGDGWFYYNGFKNKE